MREVAGAILFTLAVAVALPGVTVPATPTRALISDPVIGPNAREEVLHANDVVSSSPIRSAPIPRQPSGSFVLTSYTPAGPVSAAAGARREVFGFAPYWALTSGSSWDYSVITTVAYFGLDIDGDGSINTTTNGYQHWANDGNLGTIIDQAHAAGDRVVLVIKQFDEATICAIVTSPTVTQTAITNTMAAVASRHLDGVNVDFEGNSSPGCGAAGSIQAGFTNFMTQLSSQVHAKWPSAQVSVDTYCGSASWDGGIFNITQLGAVVDAMFVMNYDMFGNFPGHAAPNAPINGWEFNDALTVRQYVGKAPASKVILGVPYYGYKWSTSGTGPYGTAVSGAGAASYAVIQSDLACAQSLTKNWDYTAQSPWASWYSPRSNDPCGGNHGSWREVYYDDATSLGIKYDLVNSYGLRGAGMWALGYDGGAPELWSVLAAKFGTAWPGSFHALSPGRILDTRSGLGGSRSPVGPDQTIDVQVAGKGGVPLTGAAAVVVNVTVTDPTAPGFVAVFPAGSGRPLTSSLNFTAGQTSANLVSVSLGIGGKISVYNARGSTQVVVDVAGWVAPFDGAADPAGRFHPLQPARLLDTRVAGRPLGANATMDLQVSGQGGVPLAGVAAVAVNLTVTRATGASYLTAYPTGQARPTASNVNYLAGQTVANRAVVPVGAGGRITLFNATGTVHVIVDVNGWFSDASAAASTGGQLTSLSPIRIVDTRSGVGVTGVLNQNTPMAVQVAGIGSVPTADAPSPPTAVILNVTVTNPTAPSYLAVYPGGQQTPPATSDLNYVARQTTSNLVVVRLGAGGTIELFTAVGSTDVIVDVLGWYT